MAPLSAEQAALEQRWLEFLGSDCLDLLEYDFWLSPPEDLYESEEYNETGTITLTASDWNNGPCWDVACALRMWLGEAIAIEGIAVHGVARLGSWYLDGNGLSDATGIERRWAKAARANGGPRRLRPLDRSFLAEHVTPDLTLALARRMRKLLDREQFAALLETPALAL